MILEARDGGANEVLPVATLPHLGISQGGEGTWFWKLGMEERTRTIRGRPSLPKTATYGAMIWLVLPSLKVM